MQALIYFCICANHVTLNLPYITVIQQVRLEAQQAQILQMTETISGLLQELEEERAEGTRKDAETGETHAIQGYRRRNFCYFFHPVDELLPIIVLMSYLLPSTPLSLYFLVLPCPSLYFPVPPRPSLSFSVLPCPCPSLFFPALRRLDPPHQGEGELPC